MSSDHVDDSRGNKTSLPVAATGDGARGGTDGPSAATTAVVGRAVVASSPAPVAPVAPASTRPKKAVNVTVPILSTSMHVNPASLPCFKTKPCRHWAANACCPYQDQCQFAHGTVEQRPRATTEQPAHHAYYAGFRLQAPLPATTPSAFHEQLQQQPQQPQQYQLLHQQFQQQPYQQQHQQQQQQEYQQQSVPVATAVGSPFVSWPAPAVYWQCAPAPAASASPTPPAFFPANSLPTVVGTYPLLPFPASTTSNHN